MASNFEIPSPNEKMSSKYILDSVKKLKSQEAGNEVIDFREVQMEFETCGTSEGPQITTVEEAPIVETDPLAANPFSIELPNGKKYFRIGEVSQLLGVEPHVLRYWESEFKKVKPSKTSTGQRVYSRKDVETLAYIRHLLHEEKFSIRGAKKKLMENKRPSPVAPVLAAKNDKYHVVLKSVASELKDLIHCIKNDPF